MRRAATAGIQFICDLWRRLDGNVEVVTRKWLTERLEPRHHCMCLHFQRFGVTEGQAGLAGTLQHRLADWR
jgi:hypothetical protein